MEERDDSRKNLLDGFPMNGGDGLYSYTKNSSLQRAFINSGKAIIDEVIAEKLQIQHLYPNSSSFNIADLGCSVGPNTFIAMENIIEAVKSKYQSAAPASKTPQFQVFFNDHISNDFNMLFANLPSDRQYFLAGVPGSFHGRLFPKASLHLVHSSSTLHWLSRVPKEGADENSPAWSNRNIFYANAPSKVVEAYSAQFAKDMDIFLYARAQELMIGGLMLLTMPVHTNQSFRNTLFEILRASLMDLTKMGLIQESQVDSFKVPIYIASPQELEVLVKKNGCFVIERIELIVLTANRHGPEELAMHVRAGMEGLIGKHFGNEIMDKLFKQYTKNSSDFESSHLFYAENQKDIQMFVVLKRNSRSV